MDVMHGKGESCLGASTGNRGLPAQYDDTRFGGGQRGFGARRKSSPRARVLSARLSVPAYQPRFRDVKHPLRSTNQQHTGGCILSYPHRAGVFGCCGRGRGWGVTSHKTGVNVVGHLGAIDN